MIRANELMIGNYVSRPDLGNGEQRTEQVLAIYERVKTTGPIKTIVDFSDIKPIPLTEEWLIKLGFKKLDGGCLIFQKGIYEIWSNTADLKEWSLRRIVGDKNEGSYGETLNCMVNVHNKVYTVHQLQNIYYSLTGEQLTIK